MNALSSRTAKCRLSEEFHHDLRWWDAFLKRFNGKCMFLDEWPVEDVHTDACRAAAGCFFRGDWLYHNFAVDSPEHAQLHINHKETLAIVLAAKRWHKRWANKHIVIHIHSDNKTAINIINKGSTPDQTIMT